MRAFWRRARGKSSAANEDLVRRLDEAGFFKHLEDAEAEAARRPLHKREERAYAAGEYTIWFLTPRIFDLLRGEISEPAEKPYVSTEEPPWFGQPH